MIHDSYAYDAAMLDDLVRSHRPGGPLPQAFYTSPAVFNADMDRIFGRYWLHAGHSCMLPEPGDFITWQVGSDSILVVRGRDGAIRAFHNACRHRGARLCRDEIGRKPRITCPYHAWSYDLDGRCLVKTEKEFGVHERELGLVPVRLRDVAGLLFVALGDDPVDFDSAAAGIASLLAVHGLERGKVAKQATYDVKANWKLVFENNRECYHCPSAHPEYIKGTYDVMRLDPRRAAEVERVAEAANRRFAALGLEPGDASSRMTEGFWRARRAPLMEGWVTQSLDGTPVAPLMGNLKDRDVGTLRITVFPNFWQHASSDHAVATRLTPVDATRTRVDVWWIVDKDAQEGRDYDLAKLMPFWQRTSEQDWAICAENQAGVSSRGYRPGRYGLTQETNVAQFVEWYLGELQPRQAPLKVVSA
ncbi:MAG: aromatic ring-hydroxylating dioxygenase subunit alpha [Alphaproteobacteria bacterium]|nr:aromatic ring-hydroxylating dioxygenase subunit alpha [Alphaproteobacteria bacterium]